jgi:hypothetical protein
MMVDNLPQISPAGYQGGYTFTYSGGKWSTGPRIATGLTDVSCPTGLFCAAVGLARGSLNGVVYLHSGRTWSRGHLLGTRQIPVGISCTSRSFCLAITTPANNGPNGYAVYSHHTWTHLTKLPTLNGSFLMSVSCVSPQFCVATDDAGGAYIYAHGHWKTGVHIGTVDDSPIVSCTASFFCVAVSHGWADALSNGHWSGHTRIAKETELEAVSCTAGRFCLTVGNGPYGLNPGLAAWAHYAR